MNDVLSLPTPQLAKQVLREVTWEERIEGEIFEPGPGAVTERLFKLTDVANLLGGMPAFSVPFGVLAEWVRETLGDAELAGEVAAAAGECQAELAQEQKRSEQAGAPEEGEDRSREYPEERLRRKVVDLLAQRVDQCREVLGLKPKAEESAGGATGEESPRG